MVSSKQLLNNSNDNNNNNYSFFYHAGIGSVPGIGRYHKFRYQNRYREEKNGIEKSQVVN